MAFDGITISAMVQELHKNLDGGKIKQNFPAGNGRTADHLQRRKWTMQTPYECQCFSSFNLFY